VSGTGARAYPCPTYQIHICDLVLQCRIGVREHEKRADQQVRINVRLEARRPDSFDDDIDRVVDYSALVSSIRALAGAGHVNLIETLAERILDLATADPRIEAATVRVDKPDVYADAGAVGVELSRRRSPA
jgi:dihydroneopterin aldolase